MIVRTQRQNEVLIVTADNPPVNALGHMLRQDLITAINAADHDEAVTTIVLECAGRTFFAGADIAEFGKPPISPSLSDLCNAIEASTKPVVAAIHGTALGGGMEVALAAHYRVATASARFGLPEVKFGLLPGAGGTQRLPRLIGLEPALEMIVLGNSMDARRAKDSGLIDSVTADDRLQAEAIQFAEAIADARPLPRARDKYVAADAVLLEAFVARHAKKLKGSEAANACVRAVEAATRLPLEEGLALERSLFKALLAGEQSAALRHVFFAERKARRIDDLPASIEPVAIRSVGIIGAGTMGGGIAMNFLSAGMPVTLLETSQAALDRGIATIRQNYDGNVARGRTTADRVEKALALLTPSLSYDDLRDCDLVIEAVFELMEVKKQVFTALDQVAKPGAILATNTSYLDVDVIADMTARPEYVLGLHFFSPANIMKLLEVVRTTRTAPGVLATAMALASRIGKIAVVSGVCHGFIGNRILSRRQSEALNLLREGATPQQIDRVHMEFGMPMGPFQMSDLAGVDVGWHRDPSRVETVRDALCAAGRLGQKAGKGYYDYDEQRRGTPSAEAQSIIQRFVTEAGLKRRAHSDEEIRERTLYPMVNEGARILEEGIAQRASDIDVVWINGYGWPAYRGGPMFWANQVGLPKIVEAIDRHGFQVAALLRQKADRGEALD